MKVTKKISVQGEFAKPNVDIKDGDRILIIDGGTEITSQYGEQIVYKVKTRNGEKNLGINQTSTNALIDAFGDETTGWIAKEATAVTVKQMVSGSLKDVIYLVPDGFAMNNSGKIVKKDTDTEPGEKVIKLDEGEADADEIPF